MTRSPLRTLDMAYIALFAVLTAVCAWIAIPAGPIPFTLQTFSVFLVLTTLGGRRGFYTVVVYLLLGAVGLPVFSSFQGGLGVLFGAAGGFLLGLLPAALIYRFAESRLPPLPACLLSLTICYLSGIVWYLLFYSASTDLSTALRWCVFPFILPDLIKTGLALTVSRRLKPYLR
ncbi:MAG: biotin transporter BioY [Oscillibacter sp.]|nr:biotin transporter BioY [Oscillibacter sp.]